jgi:peptide/nickel transport system ATP-binding protein
VTAIDDPPTSIRSGETSLLSIEELSVEFWNGRYWEPVVDSVSVRVGEGEAVGLVGESGCGKTTTAYAVLGYRQPGSRISKGRVLFDGVDVLAARPPELRRLRGGLIGHVPQDPTTALNPAMRVGEQIAEALRNHDWAGDHTSRVRSLLQSVGLDDQESLSRRFPCQLSGGQQQRVMIAMALACHPKLVVLDEPTTGLDVTSQAQVLFLLRKLRAQQHTSMLYVTHDLGVVAELCDRVVVMYGGRVVEDAPTEEIFSRPRHPYTRGLINSVPKIWTRAGVGKGLSGRFERSELPPGCPFAPRCPLARPPCSQEAQQLAPIGPRHFVACWLWRETPPELSVAPDDQSEPLEVIDPSHLGPGLEVRSLSCSYESRRRRSRRPRADEVVREVSFSVGRGETVALVGESGSGKSTIAKAIAGLLAPRSGQIEWEGSPIASTVDQRRLEELRRMQLVFQNPDASLNPRQTVGRIIARVLDLYFSLRPGETRPRTRTLLKDVHLDDRLVQRFPRELSGGERQRVAIARALAAEPALLLCDEVLSALDVSVQAGIVALLQDLQQKHGFSILFISHDLAVVRWLAHRVIVVYRGEVCEVGATARLFSRPLHPYTLTLLASTPGRDLGESGWLSRVRADSSRPVHKGGCVFAAQCPLYLGPLCDSSSPPERRDEHGTRVRCHLEISALRDRLSEICGPSLNDAPTINSPTVLIPTRDDRGRCQ